MNMSEQPYFRNRMYKQRPESGSIYCWNCDCDSVFIGKKCSVCGKKRDIYKHQKPIKHNHI